MLKYALISYYILIKAASYPHIYAVILAYIYIVNDKKYLTPRKK